MGEAIQFRGLDDTVQAFNLHNTPGWSVWQGKSFMHRGIGEDELVTYLELVCKSKSEAIYTLKVYDDIDNVKQIKEKTEVAGSFRFVLQPELRTEGTNTQYMQMQARITELEAQLDDDDDDEGILGKIGNAALGWLQEPDKLIGIINGFKGILQSPQGPQMIGNVIREFTAPPAPVYPIKTENKKPENMPEQMQAQPISADEKLQRLSAALTKLEAHDPNVLEHLEKLALISAEEPKTFKMLISTLENF